MSRPTTLRSPWRELAAKLGGVEALATRLGVSTRAISYWSAPGQKRPMTSMS
jgi:hypothetical protein